MIKFSLISSFRTKINGLILRLFHTDDSYYVSKVSTAAPWVFCSYITLALKNPKNSDLLSSHQNMQESIFMVNIWNEMGYNVYVQDYNSMRPLPKLHNVKIVFGLEPLFERACDKYKPHYKIYYATGSYFTHQTKQVRRLTDSFNEKFHSNIPYRRESLPHNSYDIADKILLIGSSYTISTFPEQFHQKIVTIRQSSQTERIFPEIEYSQTNDFLFLGSNGNILKGIPILIDFFTNNLNYTLHIVGPIEDDVLFALRPTLTDNIIFHGYMDIISFDFLNITKRCNFIIYPSGSEGIPGAVINSMKFGLIPLVSIFSAYDGIEKIGYIFNNLTYNDINKAVSWSQTLTPQEILNRKFQSSKFVSDNFSSASFQKDFRSFFNKISL